MYLNGQECSLWLSTLHRVILSPGSFFHPFPCPLNYPNWIFFLSFRLSFLIYSIHSPLVSLFPFSSYTIYSLFQTCAMSFLYIWLYGRIGVEKLTRPYGQLHQFSLTSGNSIYFHFISPLYSHFIIDILLYRIFTPYFVLAHLLHSIVFFCACFGHHYVLLNSGFQWTS